jgi:hypothetical protein
MADKGRGLPTKIWRRIRLSGWDDAGPECHSLHDLISGYAADDPRTIEMKAGASNMRKRLAVIRPLLIYHRSLRPAQSQDQRQRDPADMAGRTVIFALKARNQGSATDVLVRPWREGALR